MGKLGEDLACEFLARRGFRIRSRGYRTSGGEIDLVAEAEALTVFVEVKTRKSASYGEPIEAVTRKKAARLKRLAGEYLRTEGARGDIRFDVICVLLDNKGDLVSIKHFPGAF